MRDEDEEAKAAGDNQALSLYDGVGWLQVAMLRVEEVQ
jgi:hypothetical protein